MMRKRETAPTNNLDSQHIDTLIGAHSVITGELSFEGAVRIDGRFEGNIQASNTGTLIVSEGAIIKGEVRVPNLVLHGTIHGNVHASENLKLGATGCLNGDVQYKIVSLTEGSTINGRCNHIGESSSKVETHPANKQNNPQKNTKLQEV